MKNARLFFMVLISILFITTISNGATYSDIDNVKWAKDSIISMANHGFVSGYEDGAFRPQNEITRAELISILNKMNKFEEEAEISFSDVNQNNWAYKEIRKAVAAGYVAGFNDNTFKPNDKVTREQVAVILNNLYKLENKNSGTTIKDIEYVSSWAREGVTNVVSAGIMSGYTDGTFGGKRSITRAEGVVALNKIIKNSIENKFGYFIKANVENEEQIEEVLENQEEVKEENKEETTAGGGSGGSGTISVNVDQDLKNVVSRIDSRIINSLETSLQKQTAQLISTSINNYLEDNTYSLDADVAKAKSLANKMTSKEYQDFKNAITSNIPVSQLIRLNEVFNLIQF